MYTPSESPEGDNINVKLRTPAQEIEKPIKKMGKTVREKKAAKKAAASATANENKPETEVENGHKGKKQPATDEEHSGSKKTTPNARGRKPSRGKDRSISKHAFPTPVKGTRQSKRILNRSQSNVGADRGPESEHHTPSDNSSEDDSTQVSADSSEAGAEAEAVLGLEQEKEPKESLSDRTGHIYLEHRIDLAMLNEVFEQLGRVQRCTMEEDVFLGTAAFENVQVCNIMRKSAHKIYKLAGLLEYKAVSENDTRYILAEAMLELLDLTLDDHQDVDHQEQDEDSDD